MVLALLSLILGVGPSTVSDLTPTVSHCQQKNAKYRKVADSEANKVLTFAKPAPPAQTRASTARAHTSAVPPHAAPSRVLLRSPPQTTYRETAKGLSSHPQNREPKPRWQVVHCARYTVPARCKPCW